MNYCKACNILDISANFSDRELKHNYYMKALKFHPDKNPDINAKKNFQEVLDSYEYLKESKNIGINIDSDIGSSVDDNSYYNILKKFTDGVVDKNIDIRNFLSILNSKYTEISCDLLKQFPKPVLLRLHQFVDQYADVLHINKEIVVELNKLMGEYTKDDIITRLNPTLDNLLKDEVYKLEFQNETYYIPLWHHELIYEIYQNCFIIQCDPVLPDYISLDQYNNIYFNLATTAISILNLSTIPIKIGCKEFNIPVCELRIKSYQRFTIKNKGISTIDTTNIYNVENRSNIFVDIHLTDI